jgi:5'-nucleotidase
MRLKVILIFLITALFLPYNIIAQEIVILHTNDVHSNVEPLSGGRNKGMGGVQRRANYIQKVREQEDNVLLLDAGDYNQGTPYFTLFKGEMEVMLYNAMKYDAVCLGNHEFDNGEAQLAERLSQAKYPTLCANYDFSKSPLKDLVKPYVIIEKGGKKIGIFGLLLDLNGYVAESARSGIKYLGVIKCANNMAKYLKYKQGCDLIIALTHLGYNHDEDSRSPSDIDLAKSSRDIDIIIGGHTHTFLEKPTVVKNRSGRGAIVTQMGTAGIYVGRIDLNYNEI